MRRLLFGFSCAVSVLGLGLFACGSSGGEGAGPSSGGEPDAAGADGGIAPSGDAGADAAPACAPLAVEDLPASPIAWQGAPRCAVDGVCTVYPAPTNGAPTRISAAPGGSTWAVAVDAVYAWKGAAGRVFSLDVETDLVAISALSDDDVWAVGYESSVAHFDGAAWTVSKLSLASALSGVHARAADDVWAVGNFGVVGHFDGNAWTSTALPGSPALADVWAAAADDVWAAEWNGGVWHYDGAWTKVADPAGGSFVAAWASGPNDAWLAGNDALLRGGPTTLAPVSIPGAGTSGFRAVWGSGPNDVWAAGATNTFHLAGGAWKKEAFRTRWLTGRSASDVVALGDTHVRQWDGATWSDVFRVAAPALRGGFRSPGGDVWFVGDEGTILRLRDGQLRKLTTTAVDLSKTRLRGVWGSSDDDVWLAGDSKTALHVSGDTVCVVPHGVDGNVTAMSGSGPNDVWALGDRGVAGHYDGATWKPVALEASSIVAFSPTDAWATGKRLLHWDGAAWSPVDVGVKDDPMNSIGPLGASGPDDVWSTAHVFLEGDRVLHYDGKTWTSSDTDASNVEAIAASSKSDVWLVDWNVHHYDGVTWAEQTKVPRRNVTVAIATPTELYFAGEDGAILRLPK